MRARSTIAAMRARRPAARLWRRRARAGSEEQIGARARVRLLFTEASLHISALLAEILDMLRIGH
jgi:hypothetical protein